MPIPLQREDKSMGVARERCCFCRVPTSSWTKLPDREPGDQVACCSSCAKSYRSEDVPSKRYWCQREDIVQVALGAVPIGSLERVERLGHVQQTLREARRGRGMRTRKRGGR